MIGCDIEDSISAPERAKKRKNTIDKWLNGCSGWLRQEIPSISPIIGLHQTISYPSAAE
jgi:hypothetical protein